MEDHSRFVLDDAWLAEQAKSLRHELAAVLHTHQLDAAVRARDVTSDVGRELEGAGEYYRVGAAEVAAAAGKRLSEALRVIEEYGKTHSAALARAVEQIRYRAYELERRLAIRIEARKRFGGVRLYVLITESLCRGDWLATGRAAIDGGADCLQLREKGLPDGELLARARRLVDVCRQRDVLCIINDRPDVALAAGADGVHVGQDELPVADVRRIVGPDLLVGLSTHTVEQVAEAVEVSPDYLAIGPMFDSPTKPQAHLAGPATLRRAIEMTSLPVVGIGGIDAANVGAVVATGCRCVCVCSGVVSQPDAAAAAREIRRQVEPRGS
jgi:thiamine-phosphate pyrophosphorylase